MLRPAADISSRISQDNARTICCTLGASSPQQPGQAQGQQCLEIPVFRAESGFVILPGRAGYRLLA